MQVQQARYLLLLLLLVRDTGSMVINVKGEKGSTCLYEQQDGMPFHFDRGELAEYMLLSDGVHITRHGVRFISKKETVKSKMQWHAMPCILQSDRHGSLCVVEADNAVSYILPCSDQLVPRISVDSEEEGTPVASFIHTAVPEDVRGCRNTLPGHTGSRVSSSRAYDLTQCDFLYSEVTALYSIEQRTLYLTHGAELSGVHYAAAGVVIVVLVSLMAQDIVDLGMSGNPIPLSGRHQIFTGITVCAGFFLSSPWSDVLVTEEDTLCYVYILAYVATRSMLFVMQYAWNGYTESKGGVQFNLMAAALMLLIIRVYMSVATPYTLGITVLLGSRLVFKMLVFAEAADQLHKAGMTFTLCIDIFTQIMDAFLVQILCWVGIDSQLDKNELVYISNISILFACITLGKAFHIHVVGMERKHAAAAAAAAEEDSGVLCWRKFI